jgi:histidinol phosphatase-like enzyme (inositol monophosphatase family)
VPAGRLDREAEVARRAAEAAGEVLRRHFRTPLRAETKSDRSPVTAADREAEAVMRRLIGAAFPGDGILGEEFGLEGEGRARLWVIDPLDGTRAYLTGRPLFATLIALLEEGVPVLGLIAQPVLGEVWLARRGAGCEFSSPIGGRAGVRPCPDLAVAELAATSPAMFGPDERARFERLAARAGRVSWGGDAYAYGLLALGLIDIIAEADLKPWDWAALVPVVEEAGGVVRDWTGSPLTFGAKGRIIALGDPARLDEVIGLLA